MKTALAAPSTRVCKGLFRLRRLGDQSDRRDRDPGGLPWPAGEEDLVARPYRDDLIRRQPTARHVDQVNAGVLQALDQHDALFETPAVLDPVCR